MDIGTIGNEGFEKLSKVFEKLCYKRNGKIVKLKDDCKMQANIVNHLLAIVHDDLLGQPDGSPKIPFQEGNRRFNCG